MAENYFEQRNIKTTKLLADVRATLPSFCEEFFIGIQHRTSPLTRLNYAYDLRIFFDFLSKTINRGKIAADEFVVADLDKVTAFDIERFLDYLSHYTYGDRECSCSVSAKERKLSTLRTFFKYYFRKDRISSNVAAKVDMPKVNEKSIIRLEANEVVDLLDTVETGGVFSAHQEKYSKLTRQRDIAIFTLFLGTGIRISELVGLNRTDIDFSANSFRVTRKGGDTSILYFNDEVATALKKYIYWLEEEIQAQTEFGAKCADSPALFLSIQGTRLGTRAVENLVKKYAKTVTPLKNITPHKLRSTFGTSLYRETNDIYVVAEVLGHSDVNTTKRHYAASSDEIRRNAARQVQLRDNDDE